MKVRVLPYQPHCFAFGGFDIQMLAAMTAAQHVGVDVLPLNPWDRDASFDALHVWGLGVTHQPAVFWAHQARKAIIMTALLPYSTPVTRLRHFASMIVGPARERRRLLEMVDVLVVVNDEQMIAAQAIGVPTDKIVSIPNIVEDEFFPPTAAAELTPVVPLKDFVLCVGNVCRRKNQLNLVRAASATGCPLVLIGPLLDGEQPYGAEVDRLVEEQTKIRWIKGLPPGSTELRSAFAQCVGHALPSLDECQPISALEAAASRKALLMADRPYAHQSYFKNAILVDPDSVESIAVGLRSLVGSPGRYVPPPSILERCRRDRVGEAYRGAYQRARDRRSLRH